jgi:acetyltransferase-like isoleucine patch superfamily enzyme
MQKISLAIIRFTAKIIGFIIPWQLTRIWLYFINHVYSSIQSRSFKKCGKNFYLEYKANLYGTKHIIVGDNFGCRRGLRIEVYDHFLEDQFSPEIIIGNNVKMGDDCHIAAINKIIIGDDTLMAGKIFITDHYHGKINNEDLLHTPAKRPLFSKGEVIIENNVWIGEGVAVLPGVVIGNHSIIGANAVITKSIPPYSVVAGNPGKVIKSIKHNAQ